MDTASKIKDLITRAKYGDAVKSFLNWIDSLPLSIDHKDCAKNLISQYEDLSNDEIKGVILGDEIDRKQNIWKKNIFNFINLIEENYPVETKEISNYYIYNLLNNNQFNDAKKSLFQFSELVQKAYHEFVKTEGSPEEGAKIVGELQEKTAHYLQLVNFPFAIHSLIKEEDKKSLNHIMNKFSLLSGAYKNLTFHEPPGQSGWYFKGKDKAEHDIMIAFLKVNSVDDLPLQEEFEKILNFEEGVNIIKLREYEINKFPPYVVYNFIDGITIREALDKFGGFHIIDAVNIISSLIKALDTIRQNEILHTNIRPSKIILDHGGVPFISSLDIIKFNKDEMQSLKRFKEACLYLSPEILDGTLREEDQPSRESLEKSDQFSLGVLLIEMLTGKPLFKADTTSGLFEKRRQFFLAPIEFFQEAFYGQMLPPNLLGLIKKMLEKDPSNRYENLVDIADMLNAIKVQELNESPLWKSFHLCYKHNKNLVKEFYKNLFVEAPELEKYFDKSSLNHQYMMLRYAIYIVFEIDTKKEFLINLLERHNSNLDISHYRLFLHVLKKTIQALLEKKHEWNHEMMNSPWEINIKKTLDAIDNFMKNREKTKTAL